MKKILLIVLMIMFVFTSAATAGNQWKSEQDLFWDITIINCQGVTTVYKDCLILYDNRFNNLVFMPNQGRIETGSGTMIKVLRNTCTDIIMISK